MKCYIVKHKGIDKIYYKNNGQRIRLNIFSNDAEVKSYDFEAFKNKTLNEAQKYLDKYKEKHGFFPTTETFKEYFQVHRDRKIESMQLMEYFRVFVLEKKDELNISPNDMTVYEQLGNWIEDYQTHEGKTLMIYDFTMNMVDKLCNYMSSDKKNIKTKQEGGIYWSKNILRYSTIHARMSKLRVFWKWLEENKYLSYDKRMSKKISELSKKIEEPQRYVPTLEEINKLAAIDFQDAELNYTRDYFIFLYNSGMRDSDGRTLTYNHIKPIGNDKEIIKRAVKTNKRFAVRLNERSEYIIKNNINEDPNIAIFSKYPLDKINILLKKMGEKSGLFNDSTDIMDDNGCYMKKYELICTSSCRHAFINNALESGATISDVMTATGHQTHKSFEMYINRYRHSAPFTHKFLEMR